MNENCQILTKYDLKQGKLFTSRCTPAARSLGQRYIFNEEYGFEQSQNLTKPTKY